MQKYITIVSETTLEPTSESKSTWPSVLDQNTSTFQHFPANGPLDMPDTSIRYDVNMSSVSDGHFVMDVAINPNQTFADYWQVICTTHLHNCFLHKNW